MDATVFDGELTSLISAVRHGLVASGELPAFEARLTAIERPQVLVDPRPGGSPGIVHGRAFDPELNRAFLVAHTQNLATLTEVVSCVSRKLTEAVRTSQEIDGQVDAEIRRIDGRG